MTDSANGHPLEMLSGYLDDVLDAEARDATDRHLAFCEDCRAELEAMRRLKQAIAEEDVPPVPLELAARIGRAVDASTIARPRRFRYIVPTTIAATIGAIGLLVALQWREGRIGQEVLRQPAPVEQERAADELKASNAPSVPASPESTVDQRAKQESGNTGALEKDAKRNEAPALKEKERDEQEPARADGAVDQAQVAPDDARRERLSADAAAEGVASAPPPAGTAAGAMARSAPAAKTVARTACEERWSDSGLRAGWEVPDTSVAEGELDRMARDVGGVGLWRGAADGRPYLLVVPRRRFEEVVDALRARGVTGLSELPTLSEGTDCTAISIALTAVPGTLAPAPR